jgi:TDG/mug DNA glycosylase family protein
MDRATVDVYEDKARDWARLRSAGSLDPVRAFAAAVPPSTPRRLDLACGPGWHTVALGEPVVATDAAVAMLELVAERAPGVPRVAHDLEALPFAAGSFGGVWAHKCLMHIAAERLPLALADLQRVLAVGGVMHARVSCDQLAPEGNDPFGGRHFTYWEPEHLRRVVIGAGFDVTSLTDDGDEWIDVAATRLRTLPDVVGGDMRLLCVGLNPSLYAADVGVGFARPGNRFWPAALAAGVVTRDRDPRHALEHHGVGFTDLVKRASVSAAELTRDELVAGVARVGALVAWLRPRVVCVLGVTGYRTAVDRGAQLGWQRISIGGAPTYVMPNPSGLNAHAQVPDLAEHLRTALAGR